MKDFLLNVFFPKKCVMCQKLDTYICGDCEKEITFIKSPTCIVCGRLSKNGRTCPRCRTKTKLNGVMISAYYEEGPLKEMIHIYKYENLKDLDKTLAGFLVRTLERCLPVRSMAKTGHPEARGISSASLVIPVQSLSSARSGTGIQQDKNNFLLTYVPMHPKKEKQRGYNQSELLEREVAGQMGMVLVENLLIKTKQTTPQIELKRRNRLKNLEGAFEVNQNIKDVIKGKKILLIDDIVTTGTTLNECAKVLKDSGAREVWGVVVGKH